MQISDLVPNLYKNNIEMINIINSEETELENNLKLNINNSFKNTFANIADEKGIENFENILGIKPNITTESLEFRRSRVMNRLVSSIPYTETFMINKLNTILGEGNWSYKLDYNAYTLEIYSLIPGRNWYLELLTFLDSIIPCNIDWKVILYKATWESVLNKFNTWDNIKDLTWQEVMDGEWSQ